jgi:L-cystine transport system permease protein
LEKLFDFDFMFHSIPAILAHLPVTMLITLVSLLFGLAIGLITALVRMNKVPVLGRLFAVYVSFIRGTPLLVQLYLVYYGIPKIIYYLQTQKHMLGWLDLNTIPPEYFAFLAFSVNLGAYLSETIRSAISAVDKGQFEAAEAIGLTKAQTLLKIVLPQAAVVALPNIGNTLISTIKDTSLVFVLGVVDIMGQARIMGARGLAFFEVYVAVALVYWAVCIVFELVLARLEKKIRFFERKGGH